MAQDFDVVPIWGASMTPVLDIMGATLRPWQNDDAPALVAGWHDSAVAASNDVPGDPSLATAQKWIRGVGERSAKRLSLDWVIEESVDGQVVGEVGLAGFSATHAGALIGYWLLPAGRGRGLATRAVQAVAGWAHCTLGLATVVAKCHESNAASQAVAARAGFVHERNDADGNELWVSRTRGTQLLLGSESDREVSPVRLRRTGGPPYGRT